MKEELKQLIDKYKDILKTYSKLLGYDKTIYENKLLSKERRTYYNGARLEFNFVLNELTQILEDWNDDENIDKLNIAIVIQQEFNRYRDCPLAPEDKGKVEALFLIIEDLRKLVKEIEK